MVRSTTWCAARIRSCANFWSNHCGNVAIRCIVISMNRARLDLLKVLPPRQHHGGSLLFDIESQLVRDLDVTAPEQRLSDMEAAIGVWAEREDLANTEDYVRNLREDNARKVFNPHDRIHRFRRSHGNPARAG